MLKSISSLFLLLLLMALPAKAMGDVPRSSVKEDALAFNFMEIFTGTRSSIDLEEINDQNLAFVEVSNTSSSSATITWLSRVSCVGRIEYGTTENLDNSIIEDKPTQVHSVLLTGLPSEQTIFYRVSSGKVTSKVLSFYTSVVSPGIPRTVYGSISPGFQSNSSGLILKLGLSGSNGKSQSLSVKVNPTDIWLLNLGNLKTANGQVFQYNDQMTAELTVEGIGLSGKPEIIHSYRVKLSDRPNGDLSEKSGSAVEQITTGAKVVSILPQSPKKAVSEKAEITPERQFLEGLLNKGSKSRADGRRGHGKPHIIPGWRGGSKMANPSRPPNPEPPPNRIHLRGDIVLKEIIKMRNERSEARDFFPDVGRHFPDLSEKLSRDTHPVTLYQGINIVALPVDPYTSVTSYSFLTDVAGATEVTAWDGVLQQFGASAIKVGENIIGDDFTFELGYGYFTTMDSTETINYEGDVLTSTQITSINAGLDLISLVGYQDSITSYTIFDELFSGTEITHFDPIHQSYQFAFRVGLSVYGDEFPVEEGTGYFIRTLEEGTFPSPADNTPPSMTINVPKDGDTVYTKQPYIEIIFGDHQWGLALETFTCLINGENKTSFFSVDEFGAIWQMDGTDELVENTNVIEAAISDLFGNERNEVSTFAVVTTPPPADEHFVNGYVFHGDTWEPLVGAAITVDSIPGVIYTDSTGHYVFPTPGLGEYRIDIQKEHFTYAQRYLLIEDGRGDMFVDDAYLSPRDEVVTRITAEGGVAVNSDGSIFTSFPANTVEEDIDVSAFNLDDPEDIPSPLPELSIFTYCAKFWPDKVEFLDTAFIDQLNSRGFASEMPIPIGHYNSETMIWEDEGMAYVGSDSVWFDYGLGHFMSYCDVNVATQVFPEPDTDDTSSSKPPDDCDPSKECCEETDNDGSPSLGKVKLKHGNTQIDYNLPSFTKLGSSFSTTFSYSSNTVRPQTVIETKTAGVPAGWTYWWALLYSGVQIDISGRRFIGIIEPSSDTTVQRVRFNATDINGEMLSTGSYFTGSSLANFYLRPFYTADYFGGPPIDSTGVWSDFPTDAPKILSNDLIIENNLDSEFGSGWSTKDIQRLYLRPDRDALIIGGDGATALFNKDSVGYNKDLAVTSYLNSAIILSQNQSNYFEELNNYSIGSAPRFLISDDFNCDSISDMAISNTGNNSIGIIFGDSLESFDSTSYLEYPVSATPKRITKGDFNCDGYPDLAITYNDGNSIGVLLNDSTGGFSNHTDFTIANNYTGFISSGNFNNDDYLDLVVCHYYPDSITVLYNDTLGGFTESITTNSPVWGTTGLIAYDFNMDSYDDIAVFGTWGPYSSAGMQFGISDGAGSFTWIGGVSVGVLASDITYGDYNGDGCIDLAVSVGGSFGGWGGFLTYSGNCFGYFDDAYGYYLQPSASCGLITTGDFDKDADPDLAIINGSYNQIHVFINDGQGTFAEQQIIPISNIAGLTSFNLQSDYDYQYTSQADDPSKLVINANSSGYTRFYPNGKKVIFDTVGLHIATIDRYGNTTSFEYDEQERLNTIAHPGNLVTTYNYGMDDGKIESITDPANRITYFDHDIDGNLISITDPEGAVTQYEYDTEHLLTKVIGPHNDTTTYVYDDNGYVTQIIGADSSTNEFVASDSYNTLNEDIEQGYGTPDNPAPYITPAEIVNYFVNTKGDTTVSMANKNGFLTQKTNPLGHNQKYEYNDAGHKTKTIYPDSTVVIYSWNDAGKMTSLTDSSNGATTYYVYDSAYNILTLEINALGDSTIYELDSVGNVIRIVNALNDTTHQFFDSTGQLTKIINALGDSVVYYNNNLGLPNSVVNELGFVTEYEYDLAGNQTAIIDALGNRTEYEYDNNGRMTIIRDPLGRETKYVYNSSLSKSSGCCGSGGSGDLLIAIVNSAGDSTKFEYDKMGRQTKVIDPLGNESITEYDGEGRVTKSIDPVGRWISYEYDKAGNMISQTDSLGRITTYEYDSRDRQTKIIDALGGETKFVYDGADNMTHLINANGDTTSFTYDLLNQKTSETDPLGNSEYFSYNSVGLIDSNITPNGDTITYLYDDLNRLILQQFPEDSVVYQYDAFGNQLQIDDYDSRLIMTYDDNGRLSTVTTGNSGNPSDIQPITTIEYVYDSAGQKTAMIDPSGDSTKYYYGINGHLDSLIDPDGGIFAFDRDILGRTTKLTRPNGTTTDYAYDQSSQLLSILHKNGSTVIDSLVYSYNGVGNVSSMTDEADTAIYGYDSLDQVISAEYTDPILPTESYEYDPLGNRITSHLSSSHTHNEANQLIEDDQYTYSYDNNGNMIARLDKSTSDSTEYIYNYKNRLIGVRDYAGGVTLTMQADYSYDGLDRRIGIFVDGDTTLYAYDGANFIGEYDETHTPVASYTNGSGIDQPFKVTINSLNYYFHSDRLGTIRSLTDNLGDNVQRYEYDAFGNIINSLSDSYFSPYAFTGREWDEEIETYYYRVRYYNSRIGKFLGNDPIGFKSGLNQSAYTKNNPVYFIDPYGLYIRPIKLPALPTIEEWLDNDGKYQDLCGKYPKHPLCASDDPPYDNICPEPNPCDEIDCDINPWHYCCGCPRINCDIYPMHHCCQGPEVPEYDPNELFETPLFSPIPLPINLPNINPILMPNY